MDREYHYWTPQQRLKIKAVRSFVTPGNADRAALRHSPESSGRTQIDTELSTQEKNFAVTHFRPTSVH
jgi:hypothetical protein